MGDGKIKIDNTDYKEAVPEGTIKYKKCEIYNVGTNKLDPEITTCSIGLKDKDLFLGNQTGARRVGDKRFDYFEIPTHGGWHLCETESKITEDAKTGEETIQDVSKILRCGTRDEWKTWGDTDAPQTSGGEKWFGEKRVFPS